MKKPKLTIELIPKTCHFSNVRTMLKPSQWDKIRKISYELADNKCEICKSTGKEQGYKHNVECHEIWAYDDVNHIQKLEGLISLCVICHQVKHIGRAIAMGKESICHKQLQKVNKWTKIEVNQYILNSFEIHKERSKHQWTLDISILEKSPYNVEIPISEKRIFEVKKYKKKKKKKETKLAGAKVLHPMAKLAASLKTSSKIINKRPPKIKK